MGVGRPTTSCIQGAFALPSYRVSPPPYIFDFWTRLEDRDTGTIVVLEPIFFHEFSRISSPRLGSRPTGVLRCSG